MNSKKFTTLILSAVLTAAVILPCCSTSASEADNGAIRDNLTSAELVKDMGFGWNLGDTLDVCNADRNGDGKIDENSDNVDETLWGNPKATQELFNQLKADGVKSVRIPVTWRDHMGEAPDYKVDEEWMDRVQEVVDYARNAGMYVIINIHHDGGGDPNFGAWVITTASTDYEAFIQKYRALWSQIAERFKDYSDYLIFESMNEVGFDNLYNRNRKEAYDLLNKINQEFVNLVRTSGGKNNKRHLLIAGYWTDISQTCAAYYKMPNDPQNRCILSVHYYTPYQFCITGENSTWGTPSEISQMKTLVGKLNFTFVSKGTPVIIGEYAASGRDLNSCVLFLKTFNELCHQYGIATFLWDNGGQVNRDTYEWRTPEFLEAIKEGNIDKSTTLTPQKQPPFTPTDASVNTEAPKATSAAKEVSSVYKNKKTAKEAVKKAKIKKLKVKSKTKKTISVSWKKVNKANGYNVQVSKNNKFKKKLFNKFTSENKISFSKKIKSKKTYYIRVRAYCSYKKANGDVGKAFGKWNKKVKRIKVK